jgi:ribosomal protein L11 methyltransferase
MLYKAIYFILEPTTQEMVEILYALLDNLDFEGISVENNTIIGYIPAKRYEQQAIIALEKKLASLGCRLKWKVKDIPDQNWNYLWESNFEPVVVNTNCVIRAPFHPEFADVTYRITIEPKMSFGTGHHQTTRLMIGQMLKIDFKGKNVLDMGCGSGILAILASMRGASHISAIDIDKWAYENTIENAAKNKINNIEVLIGGREAIPVEKFDIVLANINRNILLDQITDYACVTHKKSVLLVSGILIEDIPKLKEAAQYAGLKFVETRLLDNWAMIVFARK